MTFLALQPSQKTLTLTEHVANMPVPRQRPKFILAPGVALVVVPGKLHHLQHKQRADISVTGLIAQQHTSKLRCNYIGIAQGKGNDSLLIRLD